MILFLEYGTGTDQIHVELDAHDLRTEEFTPGVFEQPSAPVAQSGARIALLGTPSVKIPVEFMYKIANQLELYNTRDLGPLVYLYWQPYSDVTDIHRAQLYGFRFVPDTDRGYIGKRLVRAALFFTHGPWETATETQIPLTNAHATNDLAGIQVDNTYDATYDNTVAIAANVIEGDIPTPARLEITRTWVNANRMTFIWIGHNVNSDPENFDHVLEAEDGTGGVVQASAAYSDGNYMDTLAVNTTEANMITWTISADQAARMAGNHFHMMMRSGAPQGNTWRLCWHRFRIQKTGSTEIFWEGEKFMLDTSIATCIRDFDVIRIPPWYMDPGATSDTVDLVWRAQKFEDPAGSLSLDCIHLFPGDGFRQYYFLYGMVQNDRVVDNCATGITYMDTGAATARNTAISVSGTPIMLFPLKYQKLYFLCHTNSGNSAPIDITNTVKMFYRPRRLRL